MAAGFEGKLEGRYFVPDSSFSHPASLEMRDGSLVVTIRETGQTHMPEFAELGDRLGNVPRKILFDDGSVFECPDNDAVDRAFHRELSFFSRMSRWEASWKFIVFACLATVAVVFGLYRYGLPVAANLAAWATPSGVVATIDRSTLDTVDRLVFKPTSLDEDEQERYRSVFAELRSAAGLGDGDTRLLFRDGGKLGANAVALPGGTVILTDQLAQLAKHDDEIAGVLAHEIGHVTGRHSLRQVYRALGIGFMVAVILGDTSQLLDNIVSQLALLDTLSYSRKFENEADGTSVMIMNETGRNPLAFMDLIDRVFEEAGVENEQSGWLSTHPGNRERREEVIRRIDELPQ